LNLVVQSARGLRDLVFRLRNKIRRRMASKSVFSESDQTSDSENTFYVEAVRRFLSNPKEFREFRRNFDYREILEHVSYSLGLKYLALGIERHHDFLQIVEKSLSIDKTGRPFRYRYKKIGLCSPTLIRYAYIAAELDEIFDLKKIESISEIGTGYGGQSAVIQSLYKIKSYTIYDLPNVSQLTQRFLSATNPDFTSRIGNWESTTEQHSDLLLSNYAFSELPRSIQEVYLKNVVSKAKRGYMIMNSGRTNYTGRSIGKMTLNEISKYLPTLEVLEEYPLSSPDNYIIVWDLTKTMAKSA
jgi:putative sugar O-methyltransferase